MLKSTLKTSIGATLAALMFWTSPVEGNEFEEFTAAPSGNIELAGELLYFIPVIDQTSYVISSNNNRAGGEVFPNGKRHCNKFDYKPGFRVEALYDFCNQVNTADVRFVYFNAGHSDSTTGDFLFDTIGYPGDGAQAPEDTTYNGTAKIRDQFRYYAVDATLNRICVDSCVDSLTFLFGLQYANLQYKKHFNSVGSFADGSTQINLSNTLKCHSRFWGIGPELGVDYRYNLSDATSRFGTIALKGNARAAVLCGKSHTDLHYNTSRTVGTAGVNLRNDNKWQVVPTVDARLGAIYQPCACSVNTWIEFGYEWIWLQNGVNTINNYDVAYAGETNDLFNTFGLHGPYLRINVAF